MAFSLKQKIFELFGYHEAVTDSYKDANGKGIMQRYNEGVADDFDTYLEPELEFLPENVTSPELAYANLVSYLERECGGLPVISSDLYVRRKLVRYALRLNQIKGTKRSYEMLLKMIGFDTVTIVESWDTYGFDSPLTFDDADRVFDSGGCQPCSPYEVYLTGTLTLTPEIITYIFNAIEYCEPINARLTNVYYNAVLVVPNAITCYIDDNGLLVYENTADPSFSMAFDSNGNLVITSNFENNYSLNSEGELIFTP